MKKFIKSNFDFNDKETVSIIDELPLWSAPFGLRLLETVVLRRNIAALDIGFGLGFPLIEIAQRLGSSSKVFGIDPWKAAVDRTKTKIDLLGIKNVVLIEGVAESIPLPNDSIELIVSNNGINNVQNLEKVFEECKRVAKKSAQFVIAVNLDGTMLEFYNELENILRNDGLYDNILKLKKHIYEKRRPLDELILLFEKNNFSIRGVKTDSFQYRYVDATAMFSHSLIRTAFLDSWIDLVPAGKEEQIFSRVESNLNKTAEINDQLILTIPFVIIDAVRT